VCSITLRRYADAARRKARAEAFAEGQTSDGARDPAQVVLEAESTRRLWRLVAQLRPRDRDAIVARAATESPAEAAEALGISANAFRVRLHRARLALRALMAVRCPDLVKELIHEK
jgi:DNA-directed RNA polymerase specialized sigma24 family protein